MFLSVDFDLKKLKIWAFKEGQGDFSAKFFVKDIDELGDEVVLRRYIQGIAGKNKLRAVSFRILFGGDYFKKIELIDNDFFTRFKKLTDFFPFYVPVMAEVLKKFRNIFKGIPLAAFFETAFFAKLPDEEKYYALPLEFYKNSGIKKWGFHGIFHEANAQLFPPGKRVVSVVIDKQTTVCSILENKPHSISLGCTPLEGVMSRRSCGDVDPGVAFYLMNVHNFSIYQIDEMLKNESGFLGLTGYDIELGDMLKLRGKDAKVDLAFNVYQAQIMKHIGEAVTVLGGLDILVFAGGYLTTAIPLIRDLIKKISFLGIHTLSLPWDKGKEIDVITSPESKVKVYLNRTGLATIMYHQSDQFLHKTAI